MACSSAAVPDDGGRAAPKPAAPKASSPAVGAASRDFGQVGATLHAGFACSFLPDLEVLAAAHPDLRGGTRLQGSVNLSRALAPLSGLVAQYIGTAALPVRAILFDKTPNMNWSLGWHQDRTIIVRERREVPGFGPWGRKAGLVHVEPPFAIIELMVTLRIHLDDVLETNAPLLIVPGSHKLGRISEAGIAHIVGRLGTHTCLASRGDVWVYATPIVHASAASVDGVHRRVLQVDFAAVDLPGGLEWLGI